VRSYIVYEGQFKTTVICAVPSGGTGLGVENVDSISHYVLNVFFT